MLQAPTISLRTKSLVCTNPILSITCMICLYVRHLLVTCPTMGMLIFWTGPDQQETFLANLDDKVRWLRGHVFAPSTRITYASQRKLYLHFCNLGGLAPVPLSHDRPNACRYVAFFI